MLGPSISHPVCSISSIRKKEAPRFLLPTDFDLTQKVRRSNAILPNVYAGFAQFSQLQLTSIGLMLSSLAPLTMARL